MEIESSKLASEFVRYSLDIQRGLARKVSEAEPGSGVYVFDTTGYFDGGPTSLVAGVRVQKVGGNYGVLSSAAQNLFKSANTYFQFTSVPSEVTADSIGLKLVVTGGTC
uniref:Nonstructural protein WIV domain-containing protein n=1 Tax=Lygus hesperus TaxID=30085 RepID=A0A146LBM7_LYGHE